MSSRSHERRTERATAEEVAEVERQLWEFAKRIDPPGVPEAKLRPGAFLWRVHKTWHSLGRGTGGLASRSFRALRDELLRRDPPVRNLQPKLYGSTAISEAEAEQLIDVMLETWHLERNRSGKWQAKPLFLTDVTESAGNQDLEAIRENLLHTLFKGDDHLFLEEPVGDPPEIFFQERGRTSLALIIPTKGETTAHLSPTNLYGGFSSLVGNFFEAAKERYENDKSLPLLIWILRLRTIRDNSEYHEAFNSLVSYSACLTNWYFRLSQRRSSKQEEAQELWNLIIQHSAFAVHGLPDWLSIPNQRSTSHDRNMIDEDLAELEPRFFLPEKLPIALNNNRQIRRNRIQDFGLNVSVEPPSENDDLLNGRLKYWLFPARPTGDLEETADTTGLPVFNAEMSPGRDFDLAFNAMYEAVKYHLGFSENESERINFNTLIAMGWRILSVEEFQRKLLIADQLGPKRPSH